MGARRMLRAGVSSLTVLVAVLAAGTAALAQVSDDSWSLDGPNVGGSGYVDYLGAGPRSVLVAAFARDRAADDFCTIVDASVYDRGGHRMGETFRLGSVCQGRGANLDAFTINTGADIGRVEIEYRLGVGGPTIFTARCYPEDRVSNC